MDFQGKKSFVFWACFPTSNNQLSGAFAVSFRDGITHGTFENVALQKKQQTCLGGNVD